MPYLADTHCHLNFNSFMDDLPEVIQRAKDSGVERILLPGVDLATSQQAVLLSEAHDIVFAAVGVHPNDAADWTPSLSTAIRRLAEHPKVLAIGEIGLDFYHHQTSPEIQHQALAAQLVLAAELGKPIVLHSRNALSALVPLVCDWQKQLKNDRMREFPGVFHSFEGNLDEAKLISEFHFFIGIGGPVTYKNAQEKQHLAKNLPLANILLETDAPFLSPIPFRGKRNEPARILEIAQKIAELRGAPLQEVASATSRNADQLLGWSSFR